jgi:DNA invertase Pin-like site-specific DNA recombinase
MKMGEVENLKKENQKLKKELEDLRSALKSKAENQKKGMIEKASKGQSMSRAPFGYKVEKKNLVPAENFGEVEEIFEEFLAEKTSLRKLAVKHHLSVNGLKKILSNFAYIGKINFNNQIHNGNHRPIISTTLFNHVQNKLENLGIK